MNHRLVFGVVFLLLSASAFSDEVYVCNVDGQQTFSDKPCGDDSNKTISISTNSDDESEVGLSTNELVESRKNSKYFCSGEIQRDVKATTQANIDSLGGVVTIIGDFEIQPDADSDITSLEALSCLETVEGDLRISKTQTLQSLTGLDRVTSISGTLTISRNPMLRSLAGLEGLVFVGDRLSISTNDNLQSLAGLKNLEHVDGSLTFASNKKLPSLIGLERLTTLGGGLKLWWNRELQNLDGLDNLESLDYLYVHSNRKLSRCEIEHFVQSNETECSSSGKIQCTGGCICPGNLNDVSCPLPLRRRQFSRTPIGACATCRRSGCVE